MNTRDLTQTQARFQALAFSEKAAVIWQRGQPLTTRHIPGFRLHLYIVDGFFVEMWVCTRRFMVTLIRAFSDTDTLLTFVEMCSLTDLPIE